MEEKYIQVTGTNMIRDTSNMSLINTDKNELEKYLNRRNFLLQQKGEINNIKEEIKELKSDISEIKQLLIQSLKG